MKFVDEDGNPIDPADLDDYEVAEVQAAPQAPATPVASQIEPVAEVPSAPAHGGRLWLVVAVVVVVVALAVGGVFALRGRPATGPSVADRVASKTNAVKQTATTKRDEITHPPIDTCADLGKAQVDKTLAVGSGSPSMQLRVIHSAPLPSQVASALKSDASKLQILQLSANSWGVYLPQPQQDTQGPVDDFSPHTAAPQRWWKVPVDTADNGLEVGTAVSWPGGDTDAAGACQAGAAGTYAVVGDVPADAVGLRKGQVEVTAIKGDASSASETSTTGTAATTTTTTAAQSDSDNRVVAVMGSSVVVAALEYVPEQTTTPTEGR